MPEGAALATDAYQGFAAAAERRSGVEEWVTGPCNIPLFSEQERKDGICTSCRAGWTHPNNYPVED